ncbi:MAG: 3-deoxy-7-phosphoheptulonate synthase, partial [Melioribacteraceae bacterium]|nr:3-deoxy-7-phosphoheptulonate synthase [Melioribacteraceae bacterium]
MVVIMENNASDEQIELVKKQLEDFGFQIHESRGVQKTILGAIGVQPDFDTRKVSILDGVSDVYRVTNPYKLANRSFKEDDTIIKMKDVELGGNKIHIMAGPCSI